MCFLVCRVGKEPLLAANRDEVYARPFSAPRLWLADTPFWAPRDEEEGGTWIGVNRVGLVAAITNRSLLPEQPGRASRGHLVTGALARPSLAAARKWLDDAIASDPRNPFHLLLFQGAAAVLYIHGPDGTDVRDLPAGLHYVSNLHDFGSIDLDLPADADFDTIRPHLADRTPRLPNGYPICKDKNGERGTVASTLIEPGRRFLFADGPPDVAEYEAVAAYYVRH